MGVLNIPFALLLFRSMVMGKWIRKAGKSDVAGLSTRGRLQPQIGKAGFFCSISRALYFASLCPVLDPNGFRRLLGCSRSGHKLH